MNDVLGTYFSAKPVLAGCIMLLMALDINGQVNIPILERSITIRFSGERTDVVLNNISRAGGFNFSYNPAILDPAKPVSGNFNNQPVREVLNSIFQGKVEFREKRGYLILQKAKHSSVPVEEAESFIFSGYVRDTDGAPLPWVSIYDRVSLESTISNDYGFYRIRFSEKQLPLTLYYSKQGFLDTAVSIVPSTPAFVNVGLRKNIPAAPPQVNYDSLSTAAEGTVNTFFTRINETPNALNIKDTIYRKYQVSLLPYVGTNLRMSGNVINDYSLNIFGGIAQGTRKAELSGFFNIAKGDVGMAQVAGFANLNGGNVRGAQLSGFVNLVKKNVSGVQVAGFVNLDWANTEGVLISGFVNTVKGRSAGVQIAGFVNTTIDSMTGVQLAGYVNLAKGHVNGVQGAGFINLDWGNSDGVLLSGFVNMVKGSSNGVQVAGFVNTTIDSMTGVQLSGFTNIAYQSMTGTQLSYFCNVVMDTLKGTQLGFINYARHVKGMQLGFINISMSATGVPVGLMSFVNDGYHKIEFAADEIFPVNIAFRSGVNVFHNILTAGFDPFSGDSLLWNFGYGIGTSIRLNEKTSLDIDLTSSQIVEGNNMDEINLLNKGYVGIDTKMSKKFSLAFGLTVNGHVFKTDYSNYPDIYSWYTPGIFYDQTWSSDNTRMKMWLGGKVGLRFL